MRRIRTNVIKTILCIAVFIALSGCVVAYASDTEDTNAQFETAESKYPFSDIENTWKKLDDLILNVYFINNTEEDIGNFLVSLTDEELDLLLSKDTMLVNDTIIEDDGEEIRMPYYQYCLFSTINTFNSFKQTTGYSFIKLVDDLSGYYETHKITYNIVSGSEDISGTVKFSVAITRTTKSDNNPPINFDAKVSVKSGNNYTDGTYGLMRYGTTSKEKGYSTSQKINGTTYYKSRNKHIFVYELTVAIPAYTYWVADNDVPAELNARYNTRSYNWMGTGDTTLNKVIKKSKYTNTITVQANRAVCGIDCDAEDTVDTVHATMTLRLKHPELWISYDANGMTVEANNYKSDSNGIVTNSNGSTIYRKAPYNEAITETLHNGNTFGLTKTGYHFSKWNTKADGSGTNYSTSDATILPTKLKDFDSGKNNEDFPLYITLYAKYEANKLTIKYDANGGSFLSSNAITSQTMYYDTSYQLTGSTPTRTGYTFKGWTASSSWNDSHTKYTSSYSSQNAQTWSQYFDKQDNDSDDDSTCIDSANDTITLYAQWEKTITHTFNYYKFQNTTASVTFHNADSSKTMTIPSAVMNDATSDGYTWSYRGISTSSASNSTVSYDGNTTQITVKSGDSNTTYYSSYERTVRLILKDYGDNEAKIDTKTGTATMNYVGTINSPTFTFPSLNTMKLKEKDVAGTEQNETWTALGWSTTKGAKVTIDKKVGDTLTTYKDTTYHGRYEKDVTITYDANGGSVSPTSGTVTRNFNASEDKNFDNPTLTFPIPSYKENNVDEYNWGGWLYKKLSVNAEDFDSYLVGTTNNAGSYVYTPLINGTVYAYWSNVEPKLAPTTSISKSATWNNPAGDDSTVDFDNLKNIDIDGIAKVTVKAKITDKDGIGARSITVTDYFNTTMWDYYEDATYKASVSKGSFTRTDDTFTWTIPNDYTSGSEMTFTYYVKLKEKYWTVDINGKEITGDTDHYINAINDLVSYKKELNEDGNLKSTSTYQTKDKESLINLHYTIGGGLLSGLSVNKYNSTPYVVMRPVNWNPTVNQVIISSSRNNIYKDISSSYTNTYFVQYDTHAEDSSNSLFNITINSSLKGSYSYYQITNNLFDIKTIGKVEQVYNNSIGLNTSSSAISKDTTSSDLDSLNRYKTGSLLNLSSAINLHTAVTTNGVQYNYGALTSQNTMYATNQDGLKLSIYPFVRTTSTKDGEVFETTRDTTELVSKRLDIVIDATNPIITADSRVLTESDEYGEWTSSDGYVDINLVDSKTNPEAKTHTLTFEFEDEVSGVNDPNATNDWITAIKDNVQVTLVNVDSGKTVFDYSKNNYGGIVAVKYNSRSGMNKTGSVALTLDPNNEDLLGHLQLTIKVIDNVGNWEEKTYDIYSFCLTGNVNVVDTLPSADERNEAEIWNGEQGKIQISANGWVDRVKVDFEYSLVQASKKELTKRNNIIGDDYSINGDYPYDDSDYTYLPSEYLKCKWSYESGEIGGIPLALTELATTEYTLNNSILNAHLDELLANYATIELGGEAKNANGNNYAIYGTTLYTYPIYSGNEITSYLDAYTLDGSVIMNETPYPVNVIINGSKYATINYTETEDGYKASIEAQTIFESEWVKVGNEYLRPLVHYFYMPTYAEVRNGEDESDYYIVQLTAYKGSDTEFVHSVSIQLTMTNGNFGGSLKDLQTNIKDN